MRQLYEPYGAVRYADNPHGPAPTDYGYTGQRATDLGLMDYRARFYAPSLGRFVSADTIAPGVGGQALDRYMYVGGNPLRYRDPSGHYGKDVHEDLTSRIAGEIAANCRAIALQVDRGEPVRRTDHIAQWSEVDSQAIAHYNEYTDRHWATSPVNFEEVENDGRTVAEYYHFVSLEEAESRLQAAISDRDVAAFGQALHAYQDYWSHTRRGYTVPGGQAGIERMHSVCPECRLLENEDTLNQRARLVGHFPARWNDLYDASTDADDVRMRNGTHYWIVLFGMVQLQTEIG